MIVPDRYPRTQHIWGFMGGERREGRVPTTHTSACILPREAGRGNAARRGLVTRLTASWRSYDCVIFVFQ